MKEETHRVIKNIPELLDVADHNYENIFNVYKQDNHYAFNIIKNIHIPVELDEDVYYFYRVPGKLSWTALSNKVYGTIKLWWLICAANKIINPVLLPEPGMIIRIIRSEYIPGIISSMQQQTK